MSEAEGLNRAQRLELAAYVAPVIRGASEKTLKRKVTLYDPETGEVTGYATGAEALKGLAKIQDLQHAVGEGVRPKEVVCEACGKVIPGPFKSGIPPKMCRRAGGCRGQTTCAGEGCNVVPSPDAFKSAFVRRRKGAPWRCVRCSQLAAWTPEMREEQKSATRKKHADPNYRENMSAAMKKRHEDPSYGENVRAAWTPEKRAEHGRIMRESRERKAGHA